MEIRARPRGRSIRRAAAGRLALPAALLCVLVAPSSAGAVESVEVLPLAGETGGRVYTVAPDGDIWLTQAGPNFNGGVVQNLGPDGAGIEESFSTTGYYYPLGIAVRGERVYVSNFGTGLVSYRAGTPGSTDPGRVVNDTSTAERFAINGRIRFFGSGPNAAILGKNKVSLADLSDLTAGHPFYPHEVMGAGVNTNPGDPDPGWEGCKVGLRPGPDGPPGGTRTCGYWDGRAGNGDPTDSEHLSSPTDVAAGANGAFYVLESGSGSVTTVITGAESGYTPGFSFGTPGTNTGQLNGPNSIVRDPESGNLFVSDTNGRISEFNSGGAFIRSFGWGVRTGANEFESCGPEIGVCQQGRYWYGRLDFDADGDLLVDRIYEPATQGRQLGIERIDLDGGPPVQPQSVTLKGPKKVKKGRKATLAATAAPCPGQTEKVRFESGGGGQWSRLAPPKAVNASCKASLAQVVRGRSQFRAVALDAGGNVLARSPSISVGVR